MNDLAISIGNLGNYALLEGCLRSIYEAEPRLRIEIWVVYNGADDPGVTDRIAKEFPRVKLIRKKGPLGFCLTHNLVLPLYQARYVLILDDDTIVRKGALSRMVQFMDEHPDVGMAGCRTVSVDGSFQKSFGLFPTFLTELRGILRPAPFWPDSLYTETSSARDVDWLNGSFMLARREALEKVGGLDEHYYTYVCEADWCYRFRQAGFRVVFVPDAEILHIGGEHSIMSSSTVKKHDSVIRYFVNRFYFFRKHRGPWAQNLVRPIFAASAITRIAHYLLVYVLRPEARGVAASRLEAFWDVFWLCFSAKPYEMPGRRGGGVSSPDAAPFSGSS